MNGYQEKTIQIPTVTGPIDREYLKENYLNVGFKDLLIEVLEIFQQQSGEYLEILQKAIDSGDINILAEEAHTIKGSAGSVGASELANRAKAIELAAKAGEYDRAKKLFAELPEILIRTDVAITAELSYLASLDELEDIL